MIHTDHSFNNRLQHYSLKELAALYNVSPKTFKKWILPFIHEIGEKQGRFYTINQVKAIFTFVGIPNNFFDDEDWFHNNLLK